LHYVDIHEIRVAQQIVVDIFTYSNCKKNVENGDKILFTLPKYSMALTALIFTNLSLSERRKKICSTEFNPIGQETWKIGQKFIYAHT